MSIPSIALTEPVGQEGAPVVVLGPSLGTSSIVWELVEPTLREHFRTSTWDLPGHGTSQKATDPFTVAELAEGLHRAMAALEGPVLYAGISLGGATGLELLLSHPDAVAAAAIVCASPRFGEPGAWHERAAQVRTQGTPVLVRQSAERWFDDIGRTPVLGGRLLHALSDADDESYALCCVALATYDVTARLGEIAVPVLALAGEADPVSPPDHAESIAGGVRRGRAAVVSDASHLAPAEQPAAVAAELIRFFEEATR